jgi:hypothetical protein
MKPESVDVWGGEPFDTECISLLACDTKPPNADVAPEVMFGAANDGQASVALLREHFGSFLRKHQAATLVCFDAADLHWLLHDFFAARGDREAIELLWRFSRECRLLDADRVGLGGRC